MSEARTVISACRNCHGGCTARLDIEDGKVVRITPDPNSPLSGGRICPKGLSGRELLYHPDRLKYPMKRAGERGEGKWTRVSWDEAYAVIEENIHTITAKWGREAIAIAQGTGRHHINQTMRFANTLETPNWIEPGFAQCFFPRINVGNMTFGGFPVCDYYGIVNPECILVWGHNHWISGPSGESRYLIMDAVKRGSRLIVIDPRQTELSRKAELWIRPRPGTDAAVAMGMLNVIINENLYDHTFVNQWCYGFEALKERVQDYPLDKVSEISWMPEEQIAAAARMFAAAKPGTVEWGLALEHTPNCIQACRAVALIPAVTGNIDIPGGWIKGENIMPPAASNIDRLTAEQRRKRLGGGEFQLLGGPEAFSPSAHIPTLFKAILTGKPYPVRAMMLFGNNGLISFADTGYTYKVLKSLDFICAMDLFLTPTNELADLVLPAASWMELDELIAMPGMASHTVLAQQKAVRTHECKSDEEVFLELSQRLGIDWGADTTDAILDQQLSVVSAKFPEFKGLNFEQMKERHDITVPIHYRKHETTPNGFGTPTGKVELYSTIMEKLGYDPLPAFVEPPESPNSRPDLTDKYPIILTTGGRSLYYFCSENRQVPTCRKGHPFPFVDIHPETAGAYGIRDGDWVYIENTRGRITQKARVTDTMLPGVINCEYGWWYPEVETPDHGVWISNANVLTSMDPPFDPAMGTYQLRGLLCRIYKNNDDTPESLGWADRVINTRRTDT